MAERLPMYMLQRDMDVAGSKDAIQRAVVDALRDLGILARKPKSPRPAPVRLVKSEDDDEDE